VWEIGIPDRSAAEFRHAGRFREQELHIAVGGDVFDLLGPEDWMDGNKDGVGPEHPQDPDDLVKRLLHTNADAVAGLDSQLGEGLGCRHSLGVELPERQRFASAEKSGLVGDSRERLLELCGYCCQLFGRSY